MMISRVYQSSFFRNAPGLSFSELTMQRLDEIGLVETILFRHPGAFWLYKDLKL